MKVTQSTNPLHSLLRRRRMCRAPIIYFAPCQPWPPTACANKLVLTEVRNLPPLRNHILRCIRPIRREPIPTSPLPPRLRRPPSKDLKQRSSGLFIICTAEVPDQGCDKVWFEGVDHLLWPVEIGLALRYERGGIEEYTRWCWSWRCRRRAL